jgi:hypothetical protein
MQQRHPRPSSSPEISPLPRKLCSLPSSIYQYRALVGAFRWSGGCQGAVIKLRAANGGVKAQKAVTRKQPLNGCKAVLMDLQKTGAKARRRRCERSEERCSTRRLYLPLAKQRCCWVRRAAANVSTALPGGANAVRFVAVMRFQG